MYNPTRRNRNIGTAKQGHGKSNQLSIPKPAVTDLTFYERLTHYRKVPMIINAHDFLFVIEENTGNNQHACTVSDIVEIIRLIPKADYGDLRLVILRQPTRKERIVSPVWGRFIYYYEFENDIEPAIIIEAQDIGKPNRWGKHLCPEDMKELARLRADGHNIEQHKRGYVIHYSPDSVRNTQLYRTLPHEFGHYVHYYQAVELPSTDDEPFEAWQARENAYFTLTTDDKEKFAHRYADELIEKQRKLGNVPFAQIED